MKRNIKLLLSYDGTSYNGWQKQGNTDKTIQGKLEEILSSMTQEEIQIHGSGRTDAGVHAKGQVANFLTNSDLLLEEIVSYMRKNLPEDIWVEKAEEVPISFHARRSAAGKCYSYHIWYRQEPPIFERKYVYAPGGKLDINKMKEAAAFLIGKHDFQSFSSDKKAEKTSQREIFDISVEKVGNEIIVYYNGEGFLYHMVRILSGTLIEVGLGKRKPESIKTLLTEKNRENAGFTAPPQGLFLEEVKY